MRISNTGFLGGLAALLIWSNPALSEAPALQTQGTVIYLADNLDEVDKLGWCIDTLGRGFSEQLQTHSCKPQGGDVQFGYNAEEEQIYSVEFAGKCMALVDASNANVPFGLIDCDSSSADQRFVFDAATGQFSLAQDDSQCVVAGATSRQAGPFMSRDLTLGPCESTDAGLSTWVIQNG